MKTEYLQNDIQRVYNNTSVGVELGSFLSSFW